MVKIPTETQTERVWFHHIQARVTDRPRTPVGGYQSSGEQSNDLEIAVAKTHNVGDFL
ncbi:MAG: hypothetical protein JSV01_06230 [Desulfobacterales bacterium]|nr:MAG: hypothetical protein JSV01_06230 [Desulfobacterales bacterium]UCG80302.1 MAG: hypothetical protein JSV60_10110 [Desulfobacterales bacterium]